MTQCPSEHDIKLQALAAYELEYGDSADNWKALDTKAQGTVTIAGVFVGGALAFAHRLSSNTMLSVKVAVGVGVLLLLLCVGSALLVLKIRTVEAPPDGNSVSDLSAPR